MTQFGCVSPGAPPGQPLKVVTTSTPSFCARSTHRRNAASWCGGDFLVRMDGIAVHREAGDLQAARSDGVQEILRLLIAGQQRIGIAMGRAGKSARADFHGLDAQAGEVIERLLERHGTKDDCKYADFHKMIELGF